MSCDSHEETFRKDKPVCTRCQGKGFYVGETYPPKQVPCPLCRPSTKHEDTHPCMSAGQDLLASRNDKPMSTPSAEALLKDLQVYANALSDRNIMEQLTRLHDRLRDRQVDDARFQWTIEELVRMPFERLVNGLLRPIFGGRPATYDEFVFAFVLSARLARGDGRV